MNLLGDPRFEQLNPEVIYLRGKPRSLDDRDLQLLAQQAAANPRRRSRICLHDHPSDPIHQMVIAHGREVCVPPHAHLGREESFMVLSGLATVVLFAGDGSVERIIPVGPPGTGRTVSVIVPPGAWHSQVFESEMVIFHEVTSGPFNPASSVQARFAPTCEPSAIHAWLARLRTAIAVIKE